MTGEEKIRATANVIHGAYKALIRGSAIEVSSGELERAGLCLEEQPLALEVLADEYKCIKYTSSHVFASEADLSPYDLRDIVEISSLSGLSQVHIKQSFLEMMTYKIEVLEGFDSVYAALVENPQEKPTVTPPRPAESRPVSKIVLHTLEPQHYSQRTGVLTLSPTDSIAIVKKGKTRRKNGMKYDQCFLLELLFKNVNSLKSGIKFSRFLGVNDSKIDKKLAKKVSNTVAEINNKVAKVGGPNNLIKIQNKTIFINSSYL